MLYLCLLTTLFIPYISLAQAGIVYEVNKTIQAASLASSVDRAIELTKIYLHQEGPTFNTRNYNISNSQDPVGEISTGFITSGDLGDSGSCQTKSNGSCMFSSALLTDASAQEGNLVIEINFKTTGTTPAALRSKKVLLFAMGLGIENSRITKNSNTSLSDGSIASFTCVNPETSVNKGLSAGSISLQNSTSNNTAINVFSRTTTALRLCATTN